MKQTFEEEENRVQTDMEDVEGEGGRARTVRAQQSTGPESESRVPAGIPNVPPLWRPPFLPLFPRTVERPQRIRECLTFAYEHLSVLWIAHIVGVYSRYR